MGRRFFFYCRNDTRRHWLANSVRQATLPCIEAQLLFVYHFLWTGCFFSPICRRCTVHHHRYCRIPHVETRKQSFREEVSGHRLCRAFYHQPYAAQITFHRRAGHSGSLWSTFVLWPVVTMQKPAKKLCRPAPFSNPTRYCCWLHMGVVAR